MFEHSPFSARPTALFLDLELCIVIDECSFRIRPMRTACYATVRWECDLCGARQVRTAHPKMATESLLIYGQDGATTHMMSVHPGPNTRGLIATLGC